MTVENRTTIHYAANLVGGEILAEVQSDTTASCMKIKVYSNLLNISESLISKYMNAT